MPSSRQKVRDRVLQRRGLEPVARKRLQPIRVSPVAPDPTGRKTLAMRLVEDRFGKPLEELLDNSKTLAEMGKVIGISESTACRWRKRLGLGQWQTQ